MLDQFLHPNFLWLLLIIPIAAAWMWYTRNRKTAELLYPSAQKLAKGRGNSWSWLHYLPDILRLAVIALVVIGLARPRTTEENARSLSTEGIDIVMALDVSASMLSKDLKPNRLEATKEVAAEFVKNRQTDRIGFVVYSGESYTQTPLTSDHKILLNALDKLKYGLIEGGTAIGMGLATAVNRLRDSEAESKVIILLTDGENNAGQIDPLTAAQLAVEYNIRVYTIGVGTRGMAMGPVAYHPDGSGRFIYRNIPVSIDEELLKGIADVTGGMYFRATDNETLKSIYTEIDKLEKTKLQEKKYYTHDEKFENYILLAFILFCMEMIFRYTILKSFI